METTPDNPQIIYRWRAPIRAYKRRSKDILRFYIALALVLSLIVFLVGEKILVLPIWAIVFLFYVLTITPPPEVENKITKFGIETSGNTYRWDLLSHFYFVKRFDYNVLVLVSRAPFFYHIYLVVKDEETKKELIKLLSEHLIFQEHPHKTFTDKLIEWLTRLMPDSAHEEEASEASHEKVSPAPL